MLRDSLTENLEKVDSYLDPEFVSGKKIMPIKAGAILMPRSGSVALNHRAILGVDAVIVSHICAVEITDPNILNIFLYRYLCRIRMDKITKKTTGLDAVNFTDLRNIEVPVPPIEEQRRIAAILDKADEIRRKRQRALALADNFLRSLFLDMFGDPVTNPKGWNEVELDKYLDFVTSGSRGWAKYYSKKGVRFIRSLDVQMNEISSTEEVYVTPPNNREAERSSVNSGDVLLTITG